MAHLVRWCTYSRWWFSIANVFVYPRVSIACHLSYQSPISIVTMWRPWILIFFKQCRTRIVAFWVTEFINGDRLDRIIEAAPREASPPGVLWWRDSLDALAVSAHDTGFLDRSAVEGASNNPLFGEVDVEVGRLFFGLLLNSWKGWIFRISIEFHIVFHSIS